MSISNEDLLKRIEDLSIQLKEVRKVMVQHNHHFHGKTWKVIRNNRARVDVGTKNMLMQMYREQAANGEILSFQDVAYSNYSQFGEDGVLEYIFALIGTKNKVVVEMCCGLAAECNATNLIINHGWGGLLFDGNEDNITQGKAFFDMLMTRIIHPNLISAWITKSNINDLIKGNLVAGEIDLFSLDIDGNDYWLLKSLEVITPRVIILESQMFLGPDLECTVPYSDDFVCGVGEFEGSKARMHMGASVRAFKTLCEEKGYRLVGKIGIFSPNIIFMKNGVGEEYFPAVAVEDVFSDFGSWMTDRYRRMREVSFETFEWVDLKKE